MDDWSKYEALVAKRWEYYRPRFERFARGKWLSWNWAAFFATFTWLRYRKLYEWSWAYFFVSTPFLLALLVVGSSAGNQCERMLDPTPSLVFSTTVLALLCVGWVLPPLLASYLYFKHVQALIGKNEEGARTGGLTGALALQALVLVLGIIFAASLPSYADYTYRSRLSEGIVLASAARAGLEQYLDEHERLPTRIDEVTKEVSNFKGDRLVLESDGTITAVFGKWAKRLSGHSVSLVPTKKDGRIVDWVCRSKDIPDRCLPVSCRHP